MKRLKRPYSNVSEYVLDSISQYPRANEALTRLIANGVPQDEILESLYLISAARGVRPSLDEKRRRWIRSQASEIRSIRQLAQLLTTAAGQIASLNRHFVSRPNEDRGVPLVDLIPADTLTMRFLALPSSLRAYATFLKQLAPRIRSAQLNSREEPQLHPDRYIEQLLQKFHRPRALHFYDDVATLITAMNYADGVDRIVQPGTLRKRYQRKIADA